MLRFQDSLPRLPVPTLEDTAKRYLKTLHPLLSPEELAASKKEISRLKESVEKAVHTLAKLQTSMSSKTQGLQIASEAKADLKLKLPTLEETIETAKAK